MGSNNDLTTKTTPCRLDKSIVNCDANSKFIAVINDDDGLDIYSSDTYKKLFYVDIHKKMVHIQFHPKYYNIFSVTFTDSNINLYHINSIKNTIEVKVQYLSSKQNMLLKTIFSPYKEGKILATLSFGDIKIWRIDNYYNIYNINININLGIINMNYYQFKWSQSGKYLIFGKSPNKIEIFSLESKSIIYHFNYIANNFYYYLENLEEILIINKEDILLWNLLNNIKRKKINLRAFNLKDCDYDDNNSLLYLLDDQATILINDIKLQKIIYKRRVGNCKIFRLLKGEYANPKLFSKLIFLSLDNKLEILEIFSKNNIQRNSNILEANDDFWKNSIAKIRNNYDILSHINNIIEKSEIKNKNYLSINEINKEFNDCLGNTTLEEKKKIVSDNIDNFNEEENINKVYINYIKYLIKDNTNKVLLKKYLKFLKEKELQLRLIYGEDNFESYNSEINQYQACFDQSELKNELKYEKPKSEREKLLDFLKDLSQKKSENEIESFINTSKDELNNFRFNQPISFEENEELYYCRCRMILLFNIQKILMKKPTQKLNYLNYMNYCINEVLKRNLLNNDEIIKNKTYITHIIILIAIPQRKIITDYNLNLIDNQDIIVTGVELKILGFQHDDINKTYVKDDINIKDEEISLYNLKNLKLYINSNPSQKKVFKIYELYKYDKLLEYYSNKFDEKKIRIFIKKILISNVIKEAFSFFYGKNIKYPFTSELKAEDYLNKYLKFIPLKSEKTSGVTEKFSMETYIFLNKGLIIENYINEDEKTASIDEKLTNKALTNGAIVGIHHHELNHNFHNYYYCLQNGYESLKTPRKTEIEEREGGNNMERILFGRVLNELTLKQALYILNEENYKKPLNLFREGFLKLDDDFCKCKGVFNEYEKISTDMMELSEYMIIRLKPSNLYIKFKLKDDVLGFPNFDEDEDSDEF